MALSGTLSLLALKSLKPIFLVISLVYFTYDQLNYDPELLKVDHHSHFSYIEGTPNGPENWGSLNANWSLCATGRSQSPVNIRSSDVISQPPSLMSLRTFYQPAQATLVNVGHAVQLQWSGNAGGIMINREVYTLRQCHWHTPSEHTFNNKRYGMELHLVHTNTRGNIAVIGILYKTNNRTVRPDPFLARFVPYLGLIPKTNQNISVGYINPDDTRFDTDIYYRYNGSLTTPGCAENVNWTVIRKVKSVSQAQITALKKLHDADSKSNARPVQKLNARSVYMYGKIIQEQTAGDGQDHSAAAM